MALIRTSTVMDELRSQRELDRREHELNRRAYREGMDVCPRLIERTATALDEHTRAVDALHVEIGRFREEVYELRAAVEEHSRVISEVPVALRALVEVVNELRTEVRAQTKATFQLVDRFDRFDPGAAAA